MTDSQTRDCWCFCETSIPVIARDLSWDIELKQPRDCNPKYRWPKLMSGTQVHSGGICSGSKESSKQTSLSETRTISKTIKHVCWDLSKECMNSLYDKGALSSSDYYKYSMNLWFSCQRLSLQLKRQNYRPTWCTLKSHVQSFPGWFTNSLHLDCPGSQPLLCFSFKISCFLTRLLNPVNTREAPSFTC